MSTTNTVLAALQQRQSIPKLTEPAPTAAQLDDLFKAADRANDHGLLKPWQYVVISSDRRLAFGELMRDATLQSQPDMSESAQQVLVKKALRAPMIIVSLVNLHAHEKVPEIEQWMAAAGSVQLLMTAAHAMGLGAMWRTGALAYSEMVHQGLGLQAQQKITGFIYIGTPASNKKLLESDHTQCVSYW